MLKILYLFRCSRIRHPLMRGIWTTQIITSFNLQYFVHVNGAFQ